MINIPIKKEYLISALRVFVIVSIFFFIRRLDIADKYKFLLILIPSLLILSTQKVFDHFTYKDKQKPIIVRKDDTISDVYQPDEFFFENFTMETTLKSNAMIYEVEKPFWIPEGGYLDISNPNNYVKIDNLKLYTNYTMEFWIRLKYLSNNNIVYFLKDNRKIFVVNYDDKFIIINNKNKIPYKEEDWVHLVIMRGSMDTIGTSRGSIYMNGIFMGYIEDMPELSKMTESYLFRNNGQFLEYNKKYTDLSNCALVRIYDRSLTLDEIQNNYLKDASYFGVEDNDSTGKTYVQDKSLVFYLEGRTDHLEVDNTKYMDRPIVKKQTVEIAVEDSEPTKKYTLDLTDTNDWLYQAAKKDSKNKKDKKDNNVVLVDDFTEIDESSEAPLDPSGDWMKPSKESKKEKK
jgi:hypothetical protein